MTMPPVLGDGRLQRAVEALRFGLSAVDHVDDIELARYSLIEALDILEELAAEVEGRHGGAA